MGNYVYGFDFGTTNSALSILDIEKNEVIKTFSDASILFFILPNNSSKLVSFIGQPAIDAYLENRLAGRFMKSVKRVLPRTSFTETRVYNQKFTATDLVTLVLRYLKDKADDFLGEQVDNVILGRPVFFDEDPTKDKLAQDRLEKAAIKAGFTQIQFQMEPIAAAFAYERTLKTNETVLVADIGGGTSDFTIMNLGPEKYRQPNRKSDMIAQGGIYIGGDSFDSAFMLKALTPYFGKESLYESTPGKKLEVPGMLYDNISSWEKMNFFNVQKVIREIERYYVYSGRNEQLRHLITLLEKNLGYTIFKEIEKTKISLSSKNETTFNFDKDGIVIDKDISLTYYNEVIDPHINKIGRYLDEFLKKEEIQPSAIDTVFITGGSAQVKAIKNVIEERFGPDKLRSGDFLNSVSQGLAWSYYN